MLDPLSKKTWQQWAKRAVECEHRLRTQTIAPDQPGTILRDVELLLDFIGPAGVRSSSRIGSLRLEQIEPGLCRLPKAKVIESAGKSPKQYQSNW